MSRTLAIIAVVSLFLCFGLFALARTIGGDAIFHDSRNFAGIKPLIDLASHKEWKWDGGDSLALEAPINVVYRQGGSPRVTVTGDADQLQHVKVGDGRIVSDTPLPKSTASKLTAVIGGMPLRKFSVNGGEKLDLGKIDQDELELHLNGHGSVTGSGHVNKLDLTIAGSGKIALQDLSVGDADVRIFGSGKGVIAPHGKLNLFVTGSGKIALASKPSQIDQNVLGSGGIVDVNEIVDTVMQSVAANLPFSVNVNVPVAVSVSGPPPEAGHSHDDRDNGDVRSFVTRGGQNIDLGHLDQKSLSITIPGSGKIRAEGKVENLSITIFGSGKADMGKLVADNVKVNIFGSGDAFVAPKDSLSVSVKGSGTVHVRTKPRSFDRYVMGSGQILDEY